MITDKEEGNPESWKCSEDKNWGRFFMSSLKELYDVENDSLDLGDWRSKPEYFPSKWHASRKWISSFDFSNHLIPEMRLEFIDFRISWRNVPGEILKESTHLYTSSFTFSRQGVCERKLISWLRTLPLGSDDVIVIIKRYSMSEPIIVIYVH